MPLEVLTEQCDSRVLWNYKVGVVKEKNNFLFCDDDPFANPSPNVKRKIYFLLWFICKELTLKGRYGLIPLWFGAKTEQATLQTYMRYSSHHRIDWKTQTNSAIKKCWFLLCKHMARQRGQWVRTSGTFCLIVYCVTWIIDDSLWVPVRTVGNLKLEIRGPAFLRKVPRHYPLTHLLVSLPSLEASLLQLLKSKIKISIFFKF